MNKKIMIDARVVEEQYSHGIACYTYELVNNLIHKHNGTSCHFFILINKTSCLASVHLPKNIQFIFMKTSWASLLGQFELLKVIFKYRPQIFHAPSFIVPLLSRVKLIATIHDMNHVVLSKNYSFKQKIYYILLACRLRKKNTIISTVSQFSKDEIVKYMKIPSSSIYVIYNGLSSIFKPKEFYSHEELKLTKEKYNLPEKYLFTVGNNKPHKNLEALVEVYCQGNFNIPLVVLSNSYKNLTLITKKYNKSQSVIFLTPVEKQAELAKIYAFCELFIFPSLYEGFGLPPLEASACGVPVLTSCVSSLPEIMNDCAYYFDPYSSKNMKQAIHSILNLDEKDKLKKIQAGVIYSMKFNWEITAKETLNLYLT